MVEIAVGAYLISYADSFHVDDFGARKLISVLNWTLADLLVSDCIVYSVLNSTCTLRFRIVVISFVGVLVSLYSAEQKEKRRYIQFQEPSPCK